MENDQLLKLIIESIDNVKESFPEGIVVYDPESVTNSSWKIRFRKNGIEMAEIISEEDISRMNNPKGYLEWLFSHLAVDLANRK